MRKKQTPNPTAWLSSIIKNYVHHSPQNTLQKEAAKKAFAEPLIGFSSGNDPLFDDYKQHVGSFHWTPLEIFALTFPESTVTAEELTVISWILPQTSDTRSDNRTQTRWQLRQMHPTLPGGGDYRKRSRQKYML